MATSRIAELATIIATNTKHVDTHLANKGLPSLSFNADSPAGVLLDGDITTSRQTLLDATDELHALVQGPVDIIKRQPVSISQIQLAVYQRRLTIMSKSSILGSAFKPSPDSDLHLRSQPARRKQHSRRLPLIADSPKSMSDDYYDTQ